MIGTSPTAQPILTARNSASTWNEYPSDFDVVKRQLLYERPSPTSIAARAIVHVQSGDRSDVLIGCGAQDPPSYRPVLDCPARHIPRADDEVTALEPCHELGQVRGVVG